MPPFLTKVEQNGKDKSQQRLLRKHISSSRERGRSVHFPFLSHANSWLIRKFLSMLNGYYQLLPQCCIPARRAEALNGVLQPMMATC